jgi:hypothetical protein
MLLVSFIIPSMYVYVRTDVICFIIPFFFERRRRFITDQKYIQYFVQRIYTLIHTLKNELKIKNAHPLKSFSRGSVLFFIFYYLLTVTVTVMRDKKNSLLSTYLEIRSTIFCFLQGIDVCRTLQQPKMRCLSVLFILRFFSEIIRIATGHREGRFSRQLTSWSYQNF